MASCHSTVCLTRQRQQQLSIHIPSTSHTWSLGEAPAACCSQSASRHRQSRSSEATQAKQWKASYVRRPSSNSPFRPTSGRHPRCLRGVPLFSGRSRGFKHRESPRVFEGKKGTRLVYSVWVYRQFAPETGAHLPHSSKVK